MAQAFVTVPMSFVLEWEEYCNENEVRPLRGNNDTERRRRRLQVERAIEDAILAEYEATHPKRKETPMKRNREISGSRDRR